MKKNVSIIALFLVLAGAINWGFIGLFSFDLVAAIFGFFSPLTRTVYILVGAAGIYVALTFKKIFGAFL